jgi:hypothetical protein
MVSEEKSDVILASSRIFSLSLIYCCLKMICLSVVFLVFILLGILLASWIYGLASDINLEKYSNLIV